MITTLTDRYQVMACLSLPLPLAALVPRLGDPALRPKYVHGTFLHTLSFRQRAEPQVEKMHGEGGSHGSGPGDAECRGGASSPIDNTWWAGLLTSLEDGAHMVRHPGLSYVGFQEKIKHPKVSGNADIRQNSARLRRLCNASAM
ncbi:hypothetical protein HYQ46_006133 [Verticillium longisporum]|nr:hypothetical protein HYQ46_006133 [Verticillium longisporum]